MFISLLFAVAMVGDNPAEIVPPPPPPVVVTAPAPAPLTVTTEAGTFEAGPPPVEMSDPALQGPGDAVTVDSGDGWMTTGPGELARIEEATARGETDEEYDARLYAQYCDAKPWMC